MSIDVNAVSKKFGFYSFYFNNVGISDSLA